MSVTVERLMVEVQADIKDALTKLDSLEKRSSSSVSSMSKMGRKMATMFSGAAIVGGIEKTISLAMTFDKTMRLVGVQTDTSGKKLQKLSDLALKMGKDTVYSAQDAGQAMLELSKGGLSAAQIRSGALKTSLTLAAAGGLDLADAANAIVNGMGAFGLSAKQASKVTTALAGAANASSADVSDMTQALAQAGAQANATGLSISDTAAALAIFANNGVKGSDAGTSLKTVLQRLVPQTAQARNEMDKYGLSFVKRNGDFKSLGQIAGTLQQHMAKLSDAEKTHALNVIFGSDASRAALFLMKAGTKGVKDATKATTDQSSAQKLANAAMSGASGAWENFKGSVETAAIQIGQKLLPAFTKAANYGADFISKATGWGPELAEDFGFVVAPAKALWSTLKVGAEIAAKLVGAFQGLPGPVKEFVLLAGSMAYAVPKVNTALDGARTKLSAFKSGVTDAETVGRKLGQTLSVLAGAGGMMLLADSAKRSAGAMSTLEGTLGGAATGFAAAGPWGAAVGGAVGLLKGVWSWTHKAGNALTDSSKIAEDAKGGWDALTASLRATTGAYTSTSAAAAASAMAQDESGSAFIQAAGKYGVSQATIGKALTGNQKALEEVNDFTLTLNAQNNKLAASNTRIQGTIDRLSQRLVGQYNPALNSRIQALKDTQKANQATIDSNKGLSDTWIAQQRGVMNTVGDLKKHRLEMDKVALAAKGIPQKIVTRLTASGAIPAMKELKDIAAEGTTLTKRQWKMVLTQFGVEPSKANLETLIKLAKDFNAQHPRPHITVDAGSALGTIATLRASLASLHDKTIVTRMITERATKGVTMRARGGAVWGPGTATSDSIPARLSNGEFVMRAAAVKKYGLARMYAMNALAYAKGGAVGFASGGAADDAKKAAKARADSAKKAAKAWQSTGRDFLKGFVSAAKGGAQEIRKAFREADKLLAKHLNGKAQTAAERRSNQMERRLLAATSRVTAVQQKLEAAQTRLSNLRQAKSDFVSSVSSGISSQATVLNAGNSANAIQQSLAVQVEKVKKFAQMLQDLRKGGYSDAIVKQVAAAGVEGGYDAAVALLQAGKAQAQQISASFATINQVATNTSQQLGSQMYDAGIKAAEGVVAGLKKRRKAVEAALVDMAQAMQKALKKALGIHSPAKKMVPMGERTVDGFLLPIEQSGRRITKAALGMANAATAGTAKATGNRLTIAALNGGQRAGSDVTFVFNVHNPQAEPTSVTTNKTLARAAALTLV